MNLSDQKLNEILKKIIDDHQSKGSITTATTNCMNRRFRI